MTTPIPDHEKASGVPSHILMLLFACAGITAVLYFEAFAAMVAGWSREEFGYGYFIPIIAGYMVWEMRERLETVSAKPSWTGLIPFVASVLMFWLGKLGGENYTLYLSLWLLLVGLVAGTFGWGIISTLRFPLLLLICMFPLPNILTNTISFKLKLLSSRIGVGILQLFGLTACREGNVIDLGFTRLQVVDACSGLRYLIPLAVLGLILASRMKAAAWKRVVLVLSTIPISILLNSFRIASVGMLYPIFGPRVAEGFFHDFSGWLIFISGLVLLLIEMGLMKRLFRETGISAGLAEEPTRSPQDREYSWMFPGLVSIFLLISLAVSLRVNFFDRVPMVRPLADFPSVIGEWQGTRTSIEQKFLEELRPTDYFLADFRNKGGQSVSLYVAFHESQRKSKGETTHSPESCLPGSGWVFNESGLVPLPGIGSKGGTAEVRRAVMEKTGETMLVYYWFPQRGRILTNMFQLKLYSFWDALTRHRTDGALVRIITPVEDGENVRDAEGRLQRFTKDVAVKLGESLPP